MLRLHKNLLLATFELPHSCLFFLYLPSEPLSWSKIEYNYLFQKTIPNFFDLHLQQKNLSNRNVQQLVTPNKRVNLK
ncbi:hypothetical protein SDC9_184115 [bioreactor metagenome]|uniref:Uncharacterized protein n=1 Tax=bioreactor metagenome TaxID=1076179 RepID=A0A645HC50_9ZZZZ